MGKSQRDKGNRVEREVVHAFLAGDIAAERVPLSGAAGGSYKGDVIAAGFRFEVKARADGFKQIYGWLEGNDGLVIQADRKEKLAVIPLALLIELLRKYYRL
jgi:Holliday junction resolvase